MISGMRKRRRQDSKHGHALCLTKVAVALTRLMPKAIVRCIYFTFRNMGGMIGLGIRFVCLHRLAKHCGSNVAIFPHVIIKRLELLDLGDNVSIHPFCYIDALGGIKVGNDVSIAHNCSLISFNHTWTDLQTPIKYNKIDKAPISIADDVWLGCGVRVIGPCRIGSRTVIAAGAVAKGEINGNSLYGGVPVRLIREFPLRDLHRI